MSDFTTAEFVAALRKTAAANPDKVYTLPVIAEDDDGFPIYAEDCLYVEKDETGKLVGSCLVGCALVDLGVEPEAMEDKLMSFSTLNVALELGVSTDAAYWADTAQGQQDAEQPWGTAIQFADEAHKLEVV